MRTGVILAIAAVGLLLAVVLFCVGVVGSVGQAKRETDFRREVGAQRARRIVLANGVELAYSDTGGTGPIVLCLHAIGHGARDFEDLSRRLAPQYRVLALDFPGQGNSGPDLEPASAKRYAELVTEFVDQLHLDSVVLIGNSIGGATAVRYASSHPDRVNALVLCDSGGLGRPNFVARVFIGAFVQFFAAGRRGAFWFPWAFRKYYQRVLLLDPAREERDRIIRSAYEIAAPSEQAWRSFARPEENLRPILPSVQCPVLLAWAKQDFVIPVKYTQPSFALFRNHRLEMFEGGHAAFLEDPDHFEERFREFLRDVGGDPAPRK
jgi:pimeloyl-ACP methyl ester carboxylesterase